MDGVSGEHLTPNLRRGNAYVVVTSANMHVVPMRGVVPAVATVPLDEIDQVNSIGAVKDGFFYSYVWGEPKAMAVAKRFDVVRRRGVEPLPEVVGGASRDPDPVPFPARAAPTPGPVTEPRITTDASTARPTASVFSRVASMMRRSREPARSAPSRTDASTAGPTAPVFSPSTAVTTAAATAPSVVSYADWHDARDRTGPVVESFATRDAPIDDEPKPERGVDASTREGAFDVRAAVAFANERTVDRLQRRMEIEAEKEDARPSGSIASRRRGAACDARETISFVSIERGSQVLYHLERAVVTIQGRRAVANAAKTTGVDPEEVAATEAAACLAGHLPEEAYDRDEVVDAATLGDPGVDVSPLRVAADVARLVECTIRDARGRCTFVEGVEGGDAAEALVDAARDDGTRRDDSSGAMAATSIRVPGHDDILSASSSEMFSSSNPSRSSNPAAERLREGMLLATPLVSAVRVARATTEASRVIRWARRNGSDVARDGAYAREIFGALEVGMLAPRFAAEVGNTIVVERVGVFDDEDLCAAAAMAHHAKHSPAIRALALGSPKLFDATVRRTLSRGVRSHLPAPEPSSASTFPGRRVRPRRQLGAADQRAPPGRRRAPRRATLLVVSPRLGGIRGGDV